MRGSTRLARRAGKDNCAWPSYAAIGEQCFRANWPAAGADTLKRHAIAAVNELISFGLIRKEKRTADDGGDATNAYYLTPQKEWRKR